ncbi:unnamed protein product [Anisakis simplex]|uniref:TPT domain-containing protein n=1 Tax=Anisakis simplex TaxID=6269 RepID=A0A0M3JTT2_ANISI|nr:unnamed protein product [Anisakis simplex]
MGKESRAIVVPKSSGYETIETNCPIIEPPAALSAVKHSTLREILISSIVMLCVAFSWAFSTQFSKSALNLNKSHFYAPLVMVWFSTNFMSTCYPVYMVYVVISKGLKSDAIQAAHDEASKVYGRQGLTFTSYVLRTSLFLFFWTGANYSYSQSLGNISASATATIMSSNAAMVCVLGWIILRDKFVPFRGTALNLQLISIAAAVAGVMTISMDKEFVANATGICLAILSAIMAAFYKVFFKRVIGDATLGQVSMFMSGLGLMNMFVNIIPVLALTLTATETLQWNMVPWLPIIGAALLNLMFNFLTNFGIALLHPLVISIGMLFGIPISAAIDVLFRGMRVTQFFLIGSCLILLSCVVIAIPPYLFNACMNKLHCKKRTNKTSPEDDIRTSPKQEPIKKPPSTEIIEVSSEEGNIQRY